MSEEQKIIIEMVNHVLWITLNREEKHNAMDHEMVSTLITAIDNAEKDDECRAVVLQARGKSFCAGHDLVWMREASERRFKGNLEEAQLLAHFFERLYRCRKPTIAVAQGPAFGGGVCLLACCDVVLATFDAYFGFPEVRLGLIPAVITPFISAAIGHRHAQRLFITGETFSIETAQRLGLVHDIVNPIEVRHRTLAMIEQLMRNGPNAMIAAKKLMQEITPVNMASQLDISTQTIAKLRTTDEAIEGITAFFEHRHPRWQIEN